MIPKKNNKREDFKKLFYSNLTSIDIQRKLDLNNYEYQELLQEVKKELGLPTSSRRKPHRYGKYVKNAYFIKKYDENGEFEIITYSPTSEDAEAKLRLIDDGISIYEIDKATDEKMMELIQNDYFTKNMIWSDILKKYQIPYHKFYELLANIKDNLGLSRDIRTTKNTRYVYKQKNNGKYLVKKSLHGKSFQFGYYNNLNVAVKVRDYLEDIQWNVNRWQNEKERIVKEAEIENGC
ncbi:MAG: hypothetical protein IJH63_00530 [Methanobrevibacter sp.]|nr:hypothetical protein [Methanosphaera sp.]MBR0369189.1 hypothetical protein [Methanobrevibacter sp.]